MAHRRRLVVVGQDAVPPFLPRAHDDDKFHDECGVFGVYGHGEAANIAYLGMHALQHRGQESAGVVTTDGDNSNIVIGQMAQKRSDFGATLASGGPSGLAKKINALTDQMLG